MDLDTLRLLINDQLDMIITQATALREDRVRPDSRPAAAALLRDNAATLAAWETQLRDRRQETL